MNLSVLTQLLSAQVSVPAFIHQALVILCLFLYGCILLGAICPSWPFVRKMLFAYPAGLAAFSLVAFCLVTLSIPYNAVSVIVSCIVFGVLVWTAALLTTGAKERREVFPAGWREKPLTFVIAGLVILLLTAFACSGALSVTLSNDSMYNYSFYPRLIVHYGGLRPNFNTFLTDVGQGVALINTLPYLFGFEETFGIQHMLNLVFAAVFATAVYETADTDKKALRIAFAGIAVLLLYATLPYLLLSKWILANDYFAVFMFLSAYLAFDAKHGAEGIRLLYLLVPVLSILRIEGGVYVVLFLLCISVLPVANRQIACGMLLPAVVLQAIYAIRIFLTMTIIAPYRFLTEEKALLMFLLMIAAFVYLMWIRGKIFVKLQKYLGVWIILGLLLINLLLFLKDRATYLENMKAFRDNLLYSGGWGIFPMVIAAIYLVAIIGSKRWGFGFWDLLSFSYLFYVLSVSFMREGGMHSGVGDSGNRVLLQMVPILLFAALQHVTDLMKKED